MAAIIFQMALMTGLLTLSQVFLKKLLNEIDFSFFTFSVFIELIFSFYTLLIVLNMGLAMIIWIKLLAKYDFTLVYPLVSISYFWALLAGVYFFNENISANKYVGVLFVFIGVIFISKK